MTLSCRSTRRRAALGVALGVALAASLALVGAPARAQGVLVAPQAVFVDHRTRSGSVELYNPGAEPAEVTVSTLFGYPVTDSLGRTTLFTTAAPDSAAPSAAAWVSAFPRRLTLAPRQRQTVRLLVRPPQGLPVGEYWTRLVVQAKGGRVEVAGPEEGSGIQVGLNLEVRTIIALLYRKGPLSTGVALSGVRADVEGDSLAVRARLERTGTAAYLGQVHGALVDAAGRTVRSFDVPTAVYYALEPRYAVSMDGLTPGRYTLQLRVTTDREDVATGALLTSPAVREAVAVTVPPRGR
jgi:P pilus assembly chaperone PapD